MSQEAAMEWCGTLDYHNDDHNAYSGYSGYSGDINDSMQLDRTGLKSCSFVSTFSEDMDITSY
jgi:hypothetical protein